MKKLIVFDLDGAIAESKSSLDDEMFPGGNDYPAIEAGDVSIRVRDPNETKRVIEAIIACLESSRPSEPTG